MSGFFSGFSLPSLPNIFNRKTIKYPNLRKLLDNMNTSDELLKKELLELNTLELTKLYDEFKTSLSNTIKVIDDKTKEEEEQEQSTQSPTQNGGSKKKHLKKSKKSKTQKRKKSKK
jgi:hypothetical protein